MNSGLKFLFMSVLAISCVRSTWAQEATRATMQPCALPMAAPILSPFMARRMIITGEPYSALQQSERIQTLVDGTRIDQKLISTRIYRDSLGRTRTETITPTNQQIGRPERLSGIAINDPVAGVTFILNPDTRVARQITIPGFGLRTLARAENSAPIPSTSPALPSSTSQSASTGSTASITSEPPVPIQTRFSGEDLGTQTIEGLLVYGHKQTLTVPTGAEGNDRPISIVRESWCSPELRVDVLTINSDPRSGEITTRLTNIDRSDPDPALFQVPPDYTVQSDQEPAQRP